MKQQPIVIPSLSSTNFAAWVAAIRLQSGGLDLAQVIDELSLQDDPMLIRELASLITTVLDSSPPGAQTESIQGNADLKWHPILRQICTKFNRTSTADFEALELKATRTLLL